MNWFAGIIANMLNLIANGLGLLLTHALVGGADVTKNVMGDVILSGFFPAAQHAPRFGTGTFSNLMDPKATASLAPFATAFWAFGWTFILVSVYLLVMQVSGAATSATQRERLKKGLASLLIATILMWVGARFAVLVTELFFYPSEYFLTLSPLMHWTSLNTSGGQALLNSIVNLLQSILAFIVWLVYEFRRVFLYVWMVFFPLAMSFYANDKTKGIAKLWWTEWVYQMAIPFCHAVVFGIASAVASPLSGNAMTAADIFTALAGTVGLLASAVYMRRLVDVVAQSFGSSMIGFEGGARMGQLAMLGASAYVADKGGQEAVKGIGGAIGKPLKSGFRLADNKWFREGAEKAVNSHPELFTRAIQAGAGVDDIMLHHQMGAFDDGVGAGGAGLEAAAGGRLGSVERGGAPIGRTRTSRGRVPHPVFHSGTSQALSEIGSNMRQTLSNSHMGLIAKAKLHEHQMQGGVMGKMANKAIPGIGNIAQRRSGRVAGMVAHTADRYVANQGVKEARMESMRNHFREVLVQNSLASRLPNVNHLYDPKTNQFTGQSQAEMKYGQARQHLISTLQTAMDIPNERALEMTRQMERDFRLGEHSTHLHDLQGEARTAYIAARAAYRPAYLDVRAKQAVTQGSLHASPPVDPLKNKRTGTQAFLQDARNASLYKR